jgi:hypothetical protein
MKGYNYKGKRYVRLVRASHASDELSTDAQRWYVGSLTPSFWQTWPIDWPDDNIPSASRRCAMI